MRKILLVATVQSHVCQFHLDTIQMLRQNGYEVHVAARDNLNEKDGLSLEGVEKVFNIPFERVPYKKNNFIAYKLLKAIIENEEYDVLYCHTPVGGICTRLAARKKQMSLKVIYMAHGFHFYKGASFKNWLIYYPIEKLMSRYHDILITINTEDYHLAKLRRFKNKIKHVHGVGVDKNKYYFVDKDLKDKSRKSLNYSPDKFQLLCIGELNDNKNQIFLINALPYLIKEIPSIQLVLAGNGPNNNKLKNLVKELSLTDYVLFLGYKSDLERYIAASDVIVSASKREGLPRNIMEGMLMGKPIIASYNRGHKELINHNKTGFLYNLSDSDGFIQLVRNIYVNQELRDLIVKNAYQSIQLYEKENVMNELYNIICID